MSYAKAHPFGYKPVKRVNPANNKHVPSREIQTANVVREYKVARRKVVWEIDERGKRKMRLVPVTEGTDKKKKVVYDTFKTVQHRAIPHFGRPRKGRTLAEMVYDTFLFNEKE